MDLKGTGTATMVGLRGHVLLYAALYGGYGALSPFLPAFLAEHGFSPRNISTFLAIALLARLVAGPFIGRHADRRDGVRVTLVVALALSAILTGAMAGTHGFWSLMAIGLLQAVATSALAPLADTLALAAAKGGQAFEYGWVRAAGSAAFILATILTGQLVESLGLSSGPWLGAAGMALAALVAARLRVERPGTDPARLSGPIGFRGKEFRGMEFRDLAAVRGYWRIVLAAGIILGAHALHDTFAIIAWKAAGISAVHAGLLWSQAVAAEIVVFLWLGPKLLARLGPARAIEIAALAGAFRWAVQGETTWLPALIGIQCLHGLTFALLHLACLALIEERVPMRIRATALTVYGTVGLGLATALLTFAAGPLYSALGLHAFWAMSLLSLAAVPIAVSLR